MSRTSAGTLNAERGVGVRPQLAGQQGLGVRGHDREVAVELAIPGVGIAAVWRGEARRGVTKDRGAGLTHPQEDDGSDPALASVTIPA